jgi:cytochrome c oxidase cbb3-type subunit 1
MCPCDSLLPLVDPRTDSQQSEQVQLGQVDASLRGPVLFFVAKSLGWLVLGSVLGLVAAIKLVNPEFLAGHEYLTYGRVFAAGVDAMIYGWGCQAVFAVALWLMARLCRTQVKHLGLLYVAGVFWNIALLWGIGNIFFGGLTSVPFLEMPGHVLPLLGFSYVLIALWGVLSFRYRREGPVFVSQWYLLAALFMFPWMGVTAMLGIFYNPGRGVIQSIVDTWYINGVLWLFFVPVALAVIYYLLPKILGRPIFVYYLSILGFWTLIMFAGWAGPHFLVYGPIPVWMQTVGQVGNLVLLVPLLVAALNHHVTALQDPQAVWQSPVLRFTMFSAAALSLAGLVNIFISTRAAGLALNLTQFNVGYVAHLFYAVFSMAMFAAMYYLLPRVLNREWPSAVLIKAHFWAAALGIGVLVLAFYYFGWRQGAEMNNPEIDFITVVRDGSPLNHTSVAALALLAVGHLVFLVNFLWMVARSA